MLPAIGSMLVEFSEDDGDISGWEPSGVSITSGAGVSVCGAATDVGESFAGGCEGVAGLQAKMNIMNKLKTPAKK